MQYYAHSIPGTHEDRWELLRDHLEQVAALSAEFASVFGAADWGRMAGLWHDLGKYSKAFQYYIRDRTSLDGEDMDAIGKVDHSTAGAQLAITASKAFPNHQAMARLLAYCIAGHHSGLLDAGSNRASRYRCPG